MITYFNKHGKPIIRSCGNCKHFRKLTSDDKMGYCSQKPMIFAYTMAETVFAYVKAYYLCDQHEFNNEAELKEQSSPIDMREAVNMRKEESDNL